MRNGGLHTSGSLLSILIKGQTHDCDSGTFNSEIPFGRNTDGPRDCHTKRSKSDRKGQISYDIACMWNLRKGYK